MTSELGDWIRDLPHRNHPPTSTAAEVRGREADRLADLLRRERDTSHHTERANLDLIKRLKDANDKLEAIRTLTRTGYSLDPIEVRAILDEQARTAEEVLADLHREIKGD